MTPSVLRRTVTIVDVPTGSGPALRLTLESDESNAPQVLRLSLGWGVGADWREHDGYREIELPAGTLHALREALEALQFC